MSNSQKYIFSFVNAFMYLSFHYVHTNTPFDHTAKSWLVQITVKKKKKILNTYVNFFITAIFTKDKQPSKDTS